MEKGTRVLRVLCLEEVEEVCEEVGQDLPEEELLKRFFNELSSKKQTSCRPLCLRVVCLVKTKEEVGWEEEYAKVDTKRQLAASYFNRNPRAPKLPKEYAKFFNPPPYTLPSWFTEQDLDYFASKYRATGFRGPFNYYRSFDANWELSAAWTGSKILVPVKFIVGDLDLTYASPGTKEYIHGDGFKKMVPGLEEVVVMEGVAHFINQEKPQEINNHILDFIKKF